MSSLYEDLHDTMNNSVQMYDNEKKNRKPTILKKNPTSTMTHLASSSSTSPATLAFDRYHPEQSDSSHPHPYYVEHNEDDIVWPSSPATSTAADVPHDAWYYVKCSVGGIVSSSIRWGLTPLEVLKGYQQTRTVPRMIPVGTTTMLQHVVPHKYTGFVWPGLRTIYLEEGWRGLYKGLGPTAVAYACQTGTKYGLYECLKDELTHRYGKTEGGEGTPGWIRIVSAAGAELCAGVLMCPWEQLRIKVQTSSSNTNFPTRLVPATLAMLRGEGGLPPPFATLAPLWARQIPGTMANFYSFEYFARTLDQASAVLWWDEQPPNGSSSLVVSFLAGYGAGVVTAIVSHPADSLLSLYTHERQAQQHYHSSSRFPPPSTAATLVRIVNQVGWYRLATRGLAPRMLLTGTIIGGQWWIYDSFKTVMGMGKTGR